MKSLYESILDDSDNIVAIATGRMKEFEKDVATMHDIIWDALGKGWDGQLDKTIIHQQYLSTDMDWHGSPYICYYFPRSAVKRPLSDIIHQVRKEVCRKLLGKAMVIPKKYEPSASHDYVGIYLATGGKDSNSTNIYPHVAIGLNSTDENYLFLKAHRIFLVKNE